MDDESQNHNCRPGRRSGIHLSTHACAESWIPALTSLGRDDSTRISRRTERHMNVAGRHIDITTAEITCDNGMPAFFAYPTAGENFPTVIRMHERSGPVQHPRPQAMRRARDGLP